MKRALLHVLLCVVVTFLILVLTRYSVKRRLTHGGPAGIVF